MKNHVTLLNYLFAQAYKQPCTNNPSSLLETERKNKKDKYKEIINEAFLIF